MMYIDGNYVKDSPATIAVLTPGVFKAEGVFETLLALQGRIVDGELHLRRMNHAFKGAGVTLGVIQRVVDSHQWAMARVRLLAWRQGRSVHRAVVALPYKPFGFKPWRVCVINTNRPANAKRAHIKSLDYALFSDARQQAQQRGFDEALLVNAKGHIFEASRANIFWIKDGVLFTPPLSSGCLQGITRQQVMKAARRHHMNVKEKELSLLTLKHADGAFVTNSLIGCRAINNKNLA